MTAQMREVLWIDGVEHEMASLPLDSCFRRSDGLPVLYDEPQASYGASSCSALWRGYRGHWEISDARLRLRRICVWGRWGSPDDPALADDPLQQPRFSVDLARIFEYRFEPPIVAPVHATWFTGKIRVPLGDRLYYAHMGWGGDWAGERIIHVRKGMVVRDRIIDHSERFLARVQADVKEECRPDANYKAVNGVRFGIASLCWMTDEGRALVRDRLGIEYVEPIER